MAEERDTTFLTPIVVHRKYHISMYFLRKVISDFLPKERISCFREKIPSFQIIQERSCPGPALFEKTIFPESLKKISYFQVFFWERSSFIFRLRCKIIFSGKRNITFPNNTSKIINLAQIFGKTIFSGRPEKENMVFRAVLLTPTEFDSRKYLYLFNVFLIFLFVWNPFQ